jgi:hypothetical protein
VPLSSQASILVAVPASPRIEATLPRQRPLACPKWPKLATTTLPNAPPVLVEQTKQLIRTVYRHALDRLQIKHLPDSAITLSVGELDYTTAAMLSVSLRDTTAVSNQRNDYQKARRRARRSSTPMRLRTSAIA